LAKYLTSPEIQWHEANIGGHTPVRQSIFIKMKAHSGQGFERDTKRRAAMKETITHYAMIPPKFEKYPFIEDILWSGVQEAMTGKYTPKETLLLMEKKIREVLL